MTRILAALAFLILALAPAEALRLHAGPSNTPTFPTCVGQPSNATRITTSGAFTYLGWSFSAQLPVSVALNGSVFSSPICGGVWRDNVDQNTFYMNNFAQEYTAFDQARQTRSEIVPNTSGDVAPSYGKNTTYRDVFDIYVDSLTNVYGVGYNNAGFTTLSQTHGADTRYGLDIPPNPSNTSNGAVVLGTAVFSVDFIQDAPGANLKLFGQIGYITTVPTQGQFQTLLVSCTTSGCVNGAVPTNPDTLGAFNTWHTIEKIENDSHGSGNGRFSVSVDGSNIINYGGTTGFYFTDALRTHGPSSATFTGSISGNTLTVSGVTGTIAIGQYVNGLLGEVADGTQITAGSGTTWTVSGSPQTVASTNMDSVVAQKSFSYQKIGQYWGNNGCNKTGAENWCHYPPVGTRFIGARRNEYQIFLDYSAIANTGANTGSATSGVAYSQSLVLTRGSSSTGTPVFGITGSVPGLSLDTTTGVYSGTPTTPGTYTLTFTSTDTQGVTDTLPIIFTVS